jgi:hypothetical protein
MLGSALLTAAMLTLLASALLGLVAAVARGSGRPRLATQPPVAEAGEETPAVGAAGGRVSLEATQMAGLWLATGFLVVALLGRTVAVGHAPWSNLHEFSQAFAAGVVVTFLLLARRHPIAGLAPLVALVAAALIGLALSLPARIDPLVPALQQPVLLTLHVGSAMVAYAITAVAFVAAVGEIVQRRAPPPRGARPPVRPFRRTGGCCTMRRKTRSSLLGAVDVMLKAFAPAFWRVPPAKSQRQQSKEYRQRKKE